MAPAAANSSSVIEEPMPAPAWTMTSCPWRVNSLTPAGVMATRYSWFLTSLGTPTLMQILLMRTLGLISPIMSTQLI